MRKIAKWISGSGAIAAFVIFAAASAHASQSAPDTIVERPALNEAIRRTAIKSIEDKIEEAYVFTDVKPAIISKLEHSLKSDRYAVEDPRVFAERVTEDLQAVSHDGHLYLEYNPERYLAAVAPQKDDGGLDAYYRAKAVRAHHGVEGMNIVPGNIRYVRISGFQWIPDVTNAVYDEAIRFLRDGEAVIIDLRGNGGGEGDAANYFLSAIMSPNTLLYRFQTEEGVEEDRTYDFSLAGALSKKPIFVLVDGHTGSAAEAFSYALQEHKMAVIVGDPTYGAANNNQKFPISPQFILSVSYRRPLSPISGTNWEGVGVQPDIAAPSASAMNAALVEALDRLISAPGVASKDVEAYRWARIAAKAKLDPVGISRQKMLEFAGVYGETEVRAEEEGLVLSRKDRPKWRQGMLLKPLDEDGLFSTEAFAFDELRIRFTGNSIEFLYGSENAREVIDKNG